MAILFERIVEPYDNKIAFSSIASDWLVLAELGDFIPEVYQDETLFLVRNYLRCLMFMRLSCLYGKYL